jgi:hypothetical protein
VKVLLRLQGLEQNKTPSFVCAVFDRIRLRKNVLSLILKGRGARRTQERRGLSFISAVVISYTQTDLRSKSVFLNLKVMAILLEGRAIFILFQLCIYLV